MSTMPRSRSWCPANGCKSTCHLPLQLRRESLSQRARDDRPHADARAAAARRREVPAVRQDGAHEPRGLDQGPHRAVDDRGRGDGRAADPKGTRRRRSSRRRRATPGSASRWWPGRRATALKVVVPDKMSQEKIQHLRAMGAEVVLTRSDVEKGHPEYYQDVAARLAKKHAQLALRQPVRQPGQPAGALRRTTGPEISEQMDGQRRRDRAAASARAARSRASAGTSAREAPHGRR